MLGDDSDSSVMTVRVGFGEVSDMVAKGVLCTVQRGIRWAVRRGGVGLRREKRR